MCCSNRKQQHEHLEGTIFRGDASLARIMLGFAYEHSSYLEDLVEAVVLLHDLLLLCVQDGAAHQQVEVLAGQAGPHDLSTIKSKYLYGPFYKQCHRGLHIRPSNH